MTQAPSWEAPFNFVGASRLFADLPPIHWLCRALRIAPGAPTMFGGYGYSGKSVAGQSLGLSVASGAPLWGGMTCRQGKVRHLDYEQGFRITAERYRRLAYHMGLDPRLLEGVLSVGILPSCPLTPDALCRLGDGHALTIIDAWRSAHPAVDENSSEVRKTLDAMGVASEKTGCCFLPFHHNNKPSKDRPSGKYSLRGSSGFYDGCQTVFGFDGTIVGKPVVTHEKDRLGGETLPPFKLVIEDTHGGLGLSVVRVEVEEVEDNGLAALEELMALVLGMLTQRPGLSTSALALALKRNKAAVTAAVQTLLGMGELIEDGSGPTRKLYCKGYTNGAASPF